MIWTHKSLTDPYRSEGYEVHRGIHHVEVWGYRNKVYTCLAKNFQSVHSAKVWAEDDKAKKDAEKGVGP